MIEHQDVPKAERDAYKRGHRDGYNAGRRVRYRILRSDARTPNKLHELASDLYELVHHWERDAWRARTIATQRLPLNDYLKAYELAEHADRLMLSATYLADVLERHGVRSGKVNDQDPDQT